MTPNHSEPHSVWLRPDDETKHALRRAVDVLAHAQGVPAFEPHLTLLGDIAYPIAKTMKLCSDVFADVGPISAKVIGVESSDAFFMSFYLSIALPEKISDIRSKLSHRISQKAPADFVSHISLAYGALPQSVSEADKQELIEPFIGRSFLLDRVAAVRSAQSIPIAKWSIHSEIGLRV